MVCCSFHQHSVESSDSVLGDNSDEEAEAGRGLVAWCESDLNSDLLPPILVPGSMKQFEKCCRLPSSLSLNVGRARGFLPMCKNWG